MKRRFLVLFFLVVNLGCKYTEVTSKELLEYTNENPNLKNHYQAQMIFGDFRGLSNETLLTNATPSKIVVTSILLRRNQLTGTPIQLSQFNTILKEYGFIVPERIENLNEGLPPPHFKYPIGMIHGDIETNSPFKTKLELSNFSCAVCHGGVTYNSKGLPQSSVWFGSPNTSINLQGYLDEVYASLKFIRNKKFQFNRALDLIFEDLDPVEKSTIRNYAFQETVRQMDELEAGADSLIPYFMGPPGTANAIGTFKQMFGLIRRGEFSKNELGFSKIPDMSYRGFKNNLVIDGIYTPGNEQPFSKVQEHEISRSRFNNLGDIAAIFTISVQGVSPKRAEEQIPILRQVIGDFFENYKSEPFPGDVDKMMASQGEFLYNNHCSHCHGQYSRGLDEIRLVNFPNKPIPLEKIGTDPFRIQTVTPDLIKRMKKTWIGQKIQTNFGKHYIPPILSGVWKNSPYLHNRSVPTLWQLMNPELRAKKFNYGGHALDFTELGVSYPEGYTPWSKPFTVDTNQPGFSNSGHEKPFDKLNFIEKRSLIEYLKLL